MSLLPYPSYVETKCNWLRRIPDHWGLISSKRVFSERKEYADQNQEFLTASQKYGVISQSEYMKLENKKVVLNSKDITEMKRVYPGDFVISLRSFQGGLEYSAVSGAVTPRYVPIYPRKNICAKYFKYLFKSRAYISALQSTSEMVRDGQDLRYGNFIQVPLPLIPRKEQESISEFLDREVEVIDELVIEKYKLLDCIREYRESLISEVIKSKTTKEYRLNGCIERILRPIHAEAKLFKPIGLYNRGRGIFHKDECLYDELGDSDFSYVAMNDLVFSGQFAWEGAVAIAAGNDDGCIASHRYPLFRAKENVANVEYIWAFFTTQMGDFLLNENSNGSAGRNRPLNASSLLKEKIPLPSRKDQDRVATLVRRENEIRKEVHKSINFLLEKRLAIIDAAITGNIDVRNFKESSA